MNATPTRQSQMTFIGKCPHCGTVRREYRGPFREVEQTCAKCRTTVRLLPIRGVRSEKRCDARCTSAASRDCNCQCAGRNHGIDHEWKAADSA
jgi:hypothetical protein